MSFRTTLVAGLSALIMAAPALAGGIEVHDAYARAASKAAKSGAAFMVIHNHGGPDDRLIGVASPAAQKVELHTHVEDAGGVMRMMHVEEGFDLPADGKIEMRRGGRHVMFMGLTGPFEDGAMVPLTLRFQQAGEIEIEIPVDLQRKPAQADGHGHGD